MFTKSQLEEWRGYWDLSTSGNCWNGTALSNFSGKNRGIQARRVFLPIDALIRSEQDTKHFGEAMSQRLIPESLNFTRLFP